MSTALLVAALGVIALITRMDTESPVVRLLTTVTLALVVLWFVLFAIEL